jgi:hypothetical protein
MSKYGLLCRKLVFQFSEGANDFLFSAASRPALEARQIAYAIGDWEFFLRGKSGRMVTLPNTSI